MQSRSVHILSLCMSLLLAPTAVVGQDYSDGFEAPAIDPFWTPRLDSGEIFPSAQQAHEGSQSARFTSSYQPNVNKYVFLSHTLAEPAYGRVSVWAYDTGADVWSSNYITLTLYNSLESAYTFVTTFDYDLGPGQGGDVYYYMPWNGSDSVRSPIDRIVAWHRWEIVSWPGLFQVYIDGQLVVSQGASLPFDKVQIGISGPWWRPAWTAYFDDFVLDVVSTAGDLNCDGAVDFEDIDPFVLALTDPVGYAAQFPHCDSLNADCNGDGQADFDDINAFVALLGQ